MSEQDALQWGKFELKCDAPRCDYVELVAGFDASLIGKPCPKCGANLLTEEDQQAAQRMTEMVAALNKLIGKVDVPDDAEAVAISVNPHAGALNIKIPGAI